jgi:thymidylate synthase (FAD)
VDAPIFVARQLVKHQVGGVWNEVSRRYVDDEPVFYVPDVWRKTAENVKQGSSDEGHEDGATILGQVSALTSEALNHYNWLLKKGVAPEQARMILPQNTMTSWYWTGSLMFFHRVFKQRTDPHAQKETQEVAFQIGEICEQLFPVSWRALNG